MPLDHSNATATVSVAGLALGCYNPKTLNWEVALLRHDRHILNILVTKQTSEGPAEVRFQVDRRHHRIFVDASNAINPAEPLYMPTADFDRLAEGNDSEDLRWIVDMERELNNDQPVVLRRPEVPVTPLYVSHPKLYANQFRSLGDKKTELVKLTGDAAVRPFGQLAEAGNADISCQEGGAVILRIEGPLGFSMALPHIPGSTHIIEIENLCPEPPIEPGADPVELPSDFKLYYSIVEDTGGEKFDLKLNQPKAEGIRAVCNKTFLGISDHLFPLP